MEGSRTTNSVTAFYAYGVFGQVISESETIDNPFKYVGAFGVMDEGNGFYYMRARYYDPEAGRFISKDPIGLAGGINQYAYVGGNPINWIDPSGLDWVENLGNFSAGFGDVVSLGLTYAIHEARGLNDYVNQCSGWYKGGKVTGYGLLITSGVAGAARTIGKRTVVKFRVNPSYDGATVQYVKTVSKISGRTINVKQIVTRAGEILHKHNLYQGFWPF